MKIKPVILGSTGMVGEGVLHECLNHNEVESVLVINRHTCGVKNNKLQEIVLQDFLQLDSVKEKLKDYNALYFCMGVSSVGKTEEVYKKITYDLTLFIAKIMLEANSEITLTYVSGAGTDSSEKGKIMWARVKGKTENDLMKLPFRAAYMYRPGYIQPIPGLKHTYRIYKVLAPFYPLWEKIMGKYVCRLEELGKSMIKVTKEGYEKNILECTDIQKSGKNNS